VSGLGGAKRLRQSCVESISEEKDEDEKGHRDKEKEKG
jgi:hypothetical protein